MRIFAASLISVCVLLQSGEKSAAEEVASPSATTSIENGNAVVKALQDEHNQIVKKEEQKRDVLRDLYRINEDIKRVNREKVQFESQRARTQETIAGTSKIIGGLDRKVKDQRIKLKSRLRALYKFHGHGFVRLAFSKSSASDLDRTLKFLKIITDWDYGLLQDYQSSLSEYKSQQSNLSHQINRLTYLEKKVEEKKHLLETRQSDKSSIMSRIDSEKILHLTQLRRLRLQTREAVPSQERQLSQLREVENLLQPNFFEQKGQLAPPVSAPIKQAFGPVPIATDLFGSKTEEHLSLKNRGLIFAPTLSAVDVATIFSGKVAYAGVLPRFGNTLIVAHGDHFYSIYSNLGRVRVKVGDNVDKGQAVAVTEGGSSAETKGLYFEIRHFSEPLDPQQWISVRK